MTQIYNHIIVKLLVISTIKNLLLFEENFDFLVGINIKK